MNKNERTKMKSGKGNKKRVYADSSYAFAFFALMIVSLSMIIWMLLYAIFHFREKGALFFAFLMSICTIVLPFCFASMARQIFFFWDFLPEGICAPQSGRLSAVVRPYFQYRYVYIGSYRHGTLIGLGKYRGFLILSTNAIPSDVLTKVNCLQCSSEVVKTKISRKSVAKLMYYLPADLKSKVKSTLKSAGMEFA